MGNYVRQGLFAHAPALGDKLFPRRRVEASRRVSESRRGLHVFFKLGFRNLDYAELAGERQQVRLAEHQLRELPLGAQVFIAEYGVVDCEGL